MQSACVSSEKAIFGGDKLSPPKNQTLRPKGTNAPHRPFLHRILTWRPLERSSRARAQPRADARSLADACKLLPWRVDFDTSAFIYISCEVYNSACEPQRTFKSRNSRTQSIVLTVCFGFLLSHPFQRCVSICSLVVLTSNFKSLNVHLFFVVE